MDFADSLRSSWHGPDDQLRFLAAEYRDEIAQWFADRVSEGGVTSAKAAWLNVLWFDPGVSPSPPDRLPTLHHFEDIGIVSARSGWSGDASMIAFKCGPSLGRGATMRLAHDAGSGHTQPDAGG